jgi:hypothetical protein
MDLEDPYGLGTGNIIFSTVCSADDVTITMIGPAVDPIPIIRTSGEIPTPQEPSVQVNKMFSNGQRSNLGQKAILKVLTQRQEVAQQE